MIWCPYLDEVIHEIDSSPEHIIPLSLGGHNSLIVPVEKQINSKLGSEIDGAYGKEFIQAMLRNRLGVKGHSKKLAPLIVKNGNTSDGEPAQVNMGIENKDILVFSPKEMKERAALPGEELKISFKVDVDLPLRLLAKISLSAGYFVYGDLFRNEVRHSDLRFLLKKKSGLVTDQEQQIETKYYDPYTKIKEEDLQEHQLQKLFTEVTNHSVICLVPMEGSLMIYVGILGRYLGMVNVPANCKNFPLMENDHDLGHVILVSNNTFKRMSYRCYAQKCYDLISKTPEN